MRVLRLTTSQFLPSGAVCATAASQTLASSAEALGIREAAHNGLRPLGLNESDASFEAPAESVCLISAAPRVRVSTLSGSFIASPNAGSRHQRNRSRCLNGVAVHRGGVIAPQFIALN